MAALLVIALAVIACSAQPERRHPWWKTWERLERSHRGRS